MLIKPITDADESCIPAAAPIHMFGDSMSLYTTEGGMLCEQLQYASDAPTHINIHYACLSM